MNGFALRLVLMQRHKVIRKWPMYLQLDFYENPCKAAAYQGKFSTLTNGNNKIAEKGNDNDYV